MKTLDQAIAGMFTLILIYLLVMHSDNVAKILSSGGTFLTDQTKALQGR